MIDWENCTQTIENLAINFKQEFFLMSLGVLRVGKIFVNRFNLNIDFVHIEY